MRRSVPPTSKRDQPRPSGRKRARNGAARSAVFVGRERELGHLVDALESAFVGRGRLILLAGEPGIGKSRLADELAAEATGRRARVVWGRCWEAGGAPAYWPWLHALRTLVSDLRRTRLRAALGPGGAELARVLPELGTMLPDLPVPAEVDPVTDRFRLFEAATSFLKRAAADHPIVVILDDLHAADAPSLLLLRFMADELADAHLLVVACYRDTELTPEHPLSATIAELARLPLSLRLSLTGLAEADVRRFVALVSGKTPPEGLAATIHAETAGNPLFVGEVAQLLVSEGLLERPIATAVWRLSVPRGIREAITRRLARISGETNDVLALAAVLGREFDVEALALLSGLSRERLLTLLDEAVDAQVVSDVPGALGHLRFSHVLVRDTLYDELPPSQRMRLHRRIGEGLEERYRSDLEPHLAELAHHFAHAAPAGHVDKAVAYARRAGERAIRLLAYEEAARLFELALHAIELEPSIDPRVQSELLLGLGDAEARAGDGDHARQTFLHAATIAHRLASGHLLARAALGYGGRFVWSRAGTDKHLIPLLEDALASLGDDESSLRVRVMSRLAGALRDEHERDRRDALSREAVEIARRVGDAEALAYALEGRCFAIFWPENPSERLEITTELSRIAEQTGDRERLHQARFFGCVGIPLELGDLATVRAEMEHVIRLTEELRQPAQRWLVVVTRATIALLEGRFREAERLMEEAFGLGERAQQSDAVLSYRVQLFTVHLHRGGLDKVEALVRRSIGEYPARPMFHCMLAYLLAEIGRDEEARTIFDALTENRCSALPVNNEWLFSLGFLVDVAKAFGDAERAATLYELLAPYADRNACTPDYIATGSVSRPLAVAAATCSRWGEAERHFEDALRANSQMGARPWVARTSLDWAEALLSRDGPGDRERAGELAAQAAVIARELGMAPISARAEALAEGGVRRGAPTLVRPSLFRLEGEYWAIAYEGDAFRLKDSKGLRYLARLLAERGHEVHALDLVAGERVPERAAERVEPGLATSTPRDAGEILDPRAKAEYRRRLSELEEEADEARALGDAERAARADEEREFLVAELASALGLGGRDRRAASPSERARVSVTRAIRAALARIREHSPALGEHLERTIRTGTFCSYIPDSRAPLDWRL